MQHGRLKRMLITVYEVVYKYVFPPIRWIKLRTLYRLHIMSSAQTLKYIKRTHCSIARFGDSELSFVLRDEHEVAFQNYSEVLSEKLLTTLQSSDSNLLLCLPRYLSSLRGCTPECKRYWWKWGQNSCTHERIVRTIRKSTGHRYLFGDALISRPYMDRQNVHYAAEIFDQIMELWRDRDILIIEGEQTRLGVGNNLFLGCQSIRRILAPSIGAFDKYDKIKETVLNFYNGELVILALGPTATVLAADLSNIGIQALDIGHIDIEYEWFLKRTSKKEAVKGKFTNETAEGRIFSECNDEVYISQIIASI